MWPIMPIVDLSNFAWRPRSPASGGSEGCPFPALQIYVSTFKQLFKCLRQQHLHGTGGHQTTHDRRRRVYV